MIEFSGNTAALIAAATGLIGCVVNINVAVAYY
uniref:7TM_GPCR_Srx domain-containing protein n=1 Tax=Steinernema glaseri TaxID=37863 RepID=A0A1I8AP25_9BILA